MELQNNTKTAFLVGKDKEGKDIFFNIGRLMTFDKALGKTLLRYNGIDSVESLKDKATASFSNAKAKTALELLKEEATELGIKFAENISAAKLADLVLEANTAPDAE